MLPYLATLDAPFLGLEGLLPLLRKYGLRRTQWLVDAAKARLSPYLICTRSAMHQTQAFSNTPSFFARLRRAVGV
eukprot:5442077-Pleurochrysis_carterae.AAC.1